MKVPFLNLKKEMQFIKDEILKKFDRIIDNTAFISGEYVKRFEEKFADYLKTDFCIAVNSGTSALIAALMAVGLKNDDEVIMPVNTFIATAEAVSILGSKPVFVDINPKFYTMDVMELEKKINKKTKAIIPVHLYGQCADMTPIMEIAKKYNLYIIEDACQAHGAEYKGRKAGTIGDIGCFSFYPGKNLGAWGEGGACVTNNKELADRMHKIRNHGGIEKYQHEILGANFRIEEFQGAVLETKLNFLDKWNNLRIAAARKYNEILKNITDILLPLEHPYNKHVYHLFVIRTKHRDKLRDFLNNKGIASGIHYPLTLNLLNFYKKEDSLIATEISNEILSLPIFPFIAEDEINYVTEKIKSFFKEK